MLISTEKSKGKISITQTEVQLNNLKNEERAGFVEAKLGMDLLRTIQSRYQERFESKLTLLNRLR